MRASPGDRPAWVGDLYGRARDRSLGVGVACGSPTRRRLRDTATVTRSWALDPPFRVLFVCTGNICRSPFAEGLARAHLVEVLGDGADVVHVSSAGTQAVVGAPMHPDTALVLEGFGGRPAGFTARQVTREMAIEADLMVTMTRGQRRAVLGLAPQVLSRSFTLLEAAALLRSLEGDVDLPGSTFPARARALVGWMAAARSRRQRDVADDVRDPVGQPLDVHQQVGELIAGAVLEVFGALLALTDDARAGGASRPSVGGAVPVDSGR